MTGLLTGCGSGNPVVKGTVKYKDGTPVPKGLVSLSNDKNSAYGEIKADGTFTLGSGEVDDGVIPGSYKVALGGEAAGGYGGPALVTPKFLDAEKSGITIDIKPGESKDLVIEVEKP